MLEEVCPAACGHCTATATTVDAADSSSAAPTNHCSTSTAEKAAAIAALEAANDTHFPVLVRNYAMQDPCLFEGQDWVSGEECSSLALRVIDVALPAMDVIQYTEEMAASSTCITTRGTGFCGDFADLVCHDPDMVGEPRLVTLMKLVNLTEHGIETRAQVQNRVACPLLKEHVLRCASATGYFVSRRRSEQGTSQVLAGTWQMFTCLTRMLLSLGGSPTCSCVPKAAA